MVYPGHLKVALAKELSKAGVAIDAMNLEDVSTLEQRAGKAARESAAAEYLACLFLLLANNDRYGPLKT